MEITGRQYYAKDRKAWRNWLHKNHNSEPCVWLIYYKKTSGKTRVSYEDAVEEALCFGWIDGISKPLDEDKYAQRFTPRKIKSVWSALNKKRVEKLIEQKLMSPAGEAIIDAGKKNGSWEQLDHVENFTIPAELKKLFAKNKKVQKYFEGLAKFSRKQWLYRLHNAKQPETKVKRMAELVAAAAVAEKKKS